MKLRILPCNGAGCGGLAQVALAHNLKCSLVQPADWLRCHRACQSYGDPISTIRPAIINLSVHKTIA